MRSTDSGSESLAWRGRIDVLVNNAAVMRLAGGIEAEDAEWDSVWDETLRVNVLAPARLMRHAVRHFLAAGGGRCHRLELGGTAWARQSRAHGLQRVEGCGARGDQGDRPELCRAERARLIVAPGVVRTRLSEVASAATGGEAAVTATLAMGEWVPPSEVADLIAWLATGTCRHLTGATLDINGASYIRIIRDTHPALG